MRGEGEKLTFERHSGQRDLAGNWSIGIDSIYKRDIRALHDREVQQRKTNSGAHPMQLILNANTV